MGMGDAYIFLRLRCHGSTSLMFQRDIASEVASLRDLSIAYNLSSKNGLRMVFE